MKRIALLALAILLPVMSLQAARSLAALEERAARRPNNANTWYDLTLRYCEEDSIVKAVESWKHLAGLDKELAGDFFILTKVATYMGVEPFFPQLVSDTAGEAPRFSPDGKWIVFQGVRNGRTNIGLMDIFGENFRWVTSADVSDDIQYNSPDFAGSASKLIYVVTTIDGTGRSNIVIHDLETDETNELFVDMMTDLESPRMFSENSPIVFSYFSPDTRSREIAVYDREEGELTELTHNIFTDQNPGYSNDGSDIIFATDQRLVFDIYSMNPQGSGKEREIEWLGYDIHPDLGDEDSRIVFASYRHGGKQLDIFFTDRDDDRVFPVTLSQAQDYFPDLSADGNWLAFMSTRSEDGRPRIYLVSLNQPVTVETLLEKVAEEN